MKSFLLTLQFLTRIPIRTTFEIQEGDFAKGIIFFPLIGLVVGTINGLVYLGVSRFVPGLLSLVMVLLSNLLVTGGLHLDGLGDTCDGVFSGRSRDRILEIMGDSRLGSYGVIAIVFSSLLRIGLLDGIPESFLFSVLCLAPVGGRTVIALATYAFPYARKGDGLGNLYIGKTRLSTIIVCSLISLGIFYGVWGWFGGIAFLVSTVGAFLIARRISHKLDGITGDILGALNEVTELLVLGLVIVKGVIG